MQRGIAVAGVNTYEDSDLYLAPPPPLPDSNSDLAADILAADGEAGSNATDAALASTPAEPEPQVDSEPLKRVCMWFAVLLRHKQPLGPLELQ